MGVFNITGCQYGCDCESCSGWLLAPEQRAFAEWLAPSVPLLESSIEGVSYLGRSGGGGGEDWHMSRFQGFTDKIE